MVDKVGVGCEHPVREPVIAHELPDVLGGSGRGVWRLRALFILNSYSGVCPGRGYAYRGYRGGYRGGVYRGRAVAVRGGYGRGFALGRVAFNRKISSSRELLPTALCSPVATLSTDPSSSPMQYTSRSAGRRSEAGRSPCGAGTAGASPSAGWPSIEKSPAPESFCPQHSVHLLRR